MHIMFNTRHIPATLSNKIILIMDLHIAPDKTISALQIEFTEAFEGLKIVFFSKPHAEHRGSAAKFLIQDRNMLLSQLSPKLKAGTIPIGPDTVVWDLEQVFETEYNLHVQLFRKSGRTWLETSLTDNLTLAEQQVKVKASENIHQEFVDPMDYRDQE
jgi:hypothetical protein